MTDPLGLVPVTAVLPQQQPQTIVQIPVLELVSPPEALQAAATFTAIVIGRNADGTLALRSSFGALTIKTALALAPGSRIDLDMQPGAPPTVTVLGIEEPPADARDTPPPMQLDLGTTVDATVRAPPPNGAANAPPVGSHLLLRVIASPMTPGQAGLPSAAGTASAPAPGLAANAQILPAAAATPGAANAPAAPAISNLPPSSLLQGQVAIGAGGETVIETPIGTLSLDLRMALAPGTTISFARLEQTPPPVASGLPPSQASGWPIFDQTLTILDKSAPRLAQLLRNDLTPATPGALAGTLLFLLSAMYRGGWPSAAVPNALGAAGHGKLQARLDEDLSELGKLASDPATGDWRVHMLPLMNGPTVQSLRLYLRRRGATQQNANEGSRFVIEAEMSRLGPLQLDALVRGRRLDLVLRSHEPLGADLREEATAIFRQATLAAGLHGDFVFATSARFAVAPMAGIRTHVEVRI